MTVELFRFKVILFLCVSLTFGGNSAIEIKIHPVNDTHMKNVVVQTRSLPTDESNSCFTSKIGSEKMAGNSTILKVINKYGPCNPRNITKSEMEMYADDAFRVRTIAKSLQMNKDILKVNTYSSDTVGGGGSYIVGVNLGSPSSRLYLDMDTGSDLSWTQCRPCSQCYEQNDPIFDPSKSSTYSDVSCSSSSCIYNACAGSVCKYEIQYGDNSHTTGTLGADVINFCGCENQGFQNFVFGCGFNNAGLLGGSDGLLGLGRGSLSLVSQTAAFYGSYFSYCFPLSLSGTGYFVLGGNVMDKPWFTSFSNAFSSFYAMDLLGISVGTNKLSFSDALPMVVDSGTRLTHLPADVYNGVRDLFRLEMSGYPSVPSIGPFDTCYDISGYINLAHVPPIMKFYMNNLVITIDINTLVLLPNSIACFAFLPSDSGETTFGNFQQRTFEVVYDIARRQIGFAGGAC